MVVSRVCMDSTVDEVAYTLWVDDVGMDCGEAVCEYPLAQPVMDDGDGAEMIDYEAAMGWSLTVDFHVAD